MSVLSDLIRNFITGVILLFAFRHASQFATQGQFIQLLAQLIGILFLVHLLTERLFVADAPFSRRYEGLNWIVQTTLGTFSTYIVYVLVQELRNWADTRFLDSPFSFVQLATVMCIIMVLYALMYIQQRYSAPNALDVAVVVSCARVPDSHHLKASA